MDLPTAVAAHVTSRKWREGVRVGTPSPIRVQTGDEAFQTYRKSRRAPPGRTAEHAGMKRVRVKRTGIERESDRRSIDTRSGTRPTDLKVLERLLLVVHLVERAGWDDVLGSADIPQVTLQGWWKVGGHGVRVVPTPPQWEVI